MYHQGREVYFWVNALFKNTWDPDIWDGYMWIYAFQSVDSADPLNLS